MTRTIVWLKRTMRPCSARRMELPVLISIWCLTLFSGTEEVMEEHVCSSVEIQQLKSFKRLNDCTVIEGHLAILLVYDTTESDFEKLSFPRLREITDYLFLFRVHGLSSLSNLFPNLAVIRGQHLVFNEALAIYQMPDLYSVGLLQLTEVSKGSVRIQKNPALCYTDTIQWDRIIASSNEYYKGFTIDSNKNEAECADVCPRKSCKSGAISHQGYANSKHEHELCWDSRNCQIVCPESCVLRFCYTNGSTTNCCHRECLGGCSGPNSDDCFACKNVLENGVCKLQCSDGLLKYRNRRCITEAQCKAQKSTHGYLEQTQWKVVRELRECITMCPEGYKVSQNHSDECEKCDGPCPVECDGRIVTSLATANNLKTCAIINGDLEIQISGSNAQESELEANMGNIEVITGYLRVHSSAILTSLRFLKKLHTIRGETISSVNSALVIVNNLYLQEIWDVKTHPNLNILRGSIHIAHNAKLCPAKVTEFIKNGTIHNSSENKTFEGTNGYLAVCNQQQLKLYVNDDDITATEATLVWEDWKSSYKPFLLRWNINYRMASADENETSVAYNLAEDHSDAWSLKVKKSSTSTEFKESKITECLDSLEPYTRYVVYVEALVLEDTTHGAATHITFFHTKMDAPSIVQDLRAEPVSQHEIKVTWSVPHSVKGIIHHYKVEWHDQPSMRETYIERDYCIEKMNRAVTKKPVRPQNVITNKSPVDGKTCCECTKQRNRDSHSHLADTVDFEEHIIEVSFKKSDNSADEHNKNLGLMNETSVVTQMLTTVTDTTMSLVPGTVTTTLHTTQNDSRATDNKTIVTVNQTFMVLRGLSHFQEYMIEVSACNHPDDHRLCSTNTFTTARTSPDSDADSIDWHNITAVPCKDKAKAMHISWPDPVSPNLVILTFELEINSTDRHNALINRCIPYKTYLDKRGYTTEQLPPGHFSFRLRAQSLAGYGNWTPEQHFIISADPDSTTIIAATTFSIVFALALLVGLTCALKFYRKQRLMNEAALRFSANPHYMSPEDAYESDEWEVERDKVTIQEELGQGSFGNVYRGLLKQNAPNGEVETPVAVKTVNETAAIRDRIAFLQEASVMKAFNSHHVVKLFGVVSKGVPTLVIMELMSNGDLKNYLRKHRPDPELGDSSWHPPTHDMLFRMAGEIADGMAYLASKKFVHRDLAARNCMVAGNLDVKIGDFGMTRDIYSTEYYRVNSRCLMPVRWMAPESLRDGVFTTQSDVWSYGVVLWEIATLAALPYQGLGNELVFRHVVDGHKLEHVPDCPPLLTEIMQSCWVMNPAKRPSFTDIIEQLLPSLPDSFRSLSYYCTVFCSVEGQNQGNTIQAPDPHPELLEPHLEIHPAIHANGIHTSSESANSEENVACIQPLCHPVAYFANGKKNRLAGLAEQSTSAPPMLSPASSSVRRGGGLPYHQLPTA